MDLHGLRILDFDSSLSEKKDKKKRTAAKHIAFSTIDKNNMIKFGRCKEYDKNATRSSVSKTPIFIKHKSKSEIIKHPATNLFKDRSTCINSSLEDLKKINNKTRKPKKRYRICFNSESLSHDKKKVIKSKECRHKPDKEIHILYSRETPYLGRYSAKGDNKEINDKWVHTPTLPRDIFGFQNNVDSVSSTVYQMSYNEINKEHMQKIKNHAPKLNKLEQSQTCKSKQCDDKIFDLGEKFDDPSTCYNQNCLPKQLQSKDNCQVSTTYVKEVSFETINKVYCDASAGTSRDIIKSLSHPSCSLLCHSSSHENNAISMLRKPLGLPDRKTSRRYTKKSPLRLYVNSRNKKHIARNKRSVEINKYDFSSGTRKGKNFLANGHNGFSVKNCIKYTFYGSLIIIWAPCVLAVILAWMCPTKLANMLAKDQTKVSGKGQKECTEKEYQQMCRGYFTRHENKIYRKSWYTRTADTVVNSFNTVLSMFKITQKKESSSPAGAPLLPSAHPNPEKQYTLYFAEERGWLMKPIRRRNPRSENNQLLNMRCEHKTKLYATDSKCNHYKKDLCMPSEVLETHRLHKGGVMMRLVNSSGMVPHEEVYQKATPIGERLVYSPSKSCYCPAKKLYSRRISNADISGRYQSKGRPYNSTSLRRSLNNKPHCSHSSFHPKLQKVMVSAPCPPCQRPECSRSKSNEAKLSQIIPKCRCVSSPYGPKYEGPYSSLAPHEGPSYPLPEERQGPISPMSHRYAHEADNKERPNSMSLLTNDRHEVMVPLGNKYKRSDKRSFFSKCAVIPHSIKRRHHEKLTPGHEYKSLKKPHLHSNFADKRRSHISSRDRHEPGPLLANDSSEILTPAAQELSSGEPTKKQRVTKFTRGDPEKEQRVTKFSRAEPAKKQRVSKYSRGEPAKNQRVTEFSRGVPDPELLVNDNSEKLASKGYEYKSSKKRALFSKFTCKRYSTIFSKDEPNPKTLLSNRYPQELAPVEHKYKPLKKCRFISKFVEKGGERHSNRILVDDISKHQTRQVKSAPILMVTKEKAVEQRLAKDDKVMARSTKINYKIQKRMLLKEQRRKRKNEERELKIKRRAKEKKLKMELKAKEKKLKIKRRAEEKNLKMKVRAEEKKLKKKILAKEKKLKKKRREDEKNQRNKEKRKIIYEKRMKQEIKNAVKCYEREKEQVFKKIRKWFTWKKIKHFTRTYLRDSPGSGLSDCKQKSKRPRRRQFCRRICSCCRNCLSCLRMLCISCLLLCSLLCWLPTMVCCTICSRR